MFRNSPKIDGFKIPGYTRQVLISLFADDTALYLKKSDRYADVTDILDRWCAASGAKFNINKTEVIPIGSEEHRNRVITTRRLHEDDPHPLPTDIRIAPDGEVTRYLGAWIGNNIDDVAPWEVTLDKVQSALARWALSHPTLLGKQIVVQWIVGGMTQYLAKVQGMPRTIEDALVKIIRNFIWDGAKSPSLSLENLYLPIEAGGIGLLDIVTRNQAITITWLRDYLDLSPKRPAWAFIVDILINEYAPADIIGLENMNVFLQTWEPPKRGPKHNALPSYVREMLKIARTYNVNFAALRLTHDLCTQLPAWHH
ncbi:hypothetical protein DENSPDRAFT_781462, partial [Dentipellis sp. KUC8613]